MSKKFNAGSRGFTLLEMLTVVVVVGLVLSMMGLEFYGVVSNTLHTRANMDAETMARLAAAKVNKEMRLAAQDTTDNLAQPAIVQPGGATKPTPGPIAEFYRVQQGSLGQAIPICGGTINPGAPCPPFDDVVIQIDPKVPGELDEIVTPVKTGIAETPIVLARNVTGFTVTPNGSQYDLAITITTPSTHCVSNGCSFTINTAVYSGGTG